MMPRCGVLRAAAGLGLVTLTAAQTFPNTTYPDAQLPSIPDLTNATSPPKYPSPWMDGSGGWDAAYAKAQDFVRQLTLLEKVNLTTGVGWSNDLCVGNVGGVPRLNFTGLCMQDSPLGVRFADYVSAFAAGGTVAAAWDRDLWYERGYLMGSEFRDKGIDVQLGPVVGPLGRAPAGGRNWEGFSPDPVLSGIAIAQTIKGIQDAGVVATTKHYIMNEQEHFRQVGESIGYGFNISETSSSNLDDKTMHELYLWPFADAVRAGTGAIMCSYQQINNSYGCANSYTLNYLLKGELGFQGFVMSDWQAQHAGVSTALAGLDMSMPGDVLFNTYDSYWGANLTIAVLNGTVPEWRLDDMATRIMAAYYLVGRDTRRVPINFSSWTTDTFGFRQFFSSRNYGLINQHVDVRAQHGRAIREHAARSTVLLKNNGSLPLTGNEKFTAVFGEDAADSKYGPNGCPNRGCSNGTVAMGWGSGTADFPYLVSPLAAIQQNQWYDGHVVQSVTDNYAYSQIETIAKQASVALVFVNSQSGEGFINFDGNIGDRNNLTLWNNGETLIQNVSSLCNNTIVVIHSTGPVEVGDWYENPNITALLWAGLPGQESGNSIADILYGRVNPAGKLPFTLGANRSDYGADVLYEPNNGGGPPQDNFQEGVFIDYRAFDRAEIEPVFEFGFGLTYTTFNYSNISVERKNAGPYTPTTGQTAAAPVLGSGYSNNTADYQFPANLSYVPSFIYPYLNSTDLAEASNSTDYGRTDFIPPGALSSEPQPRIAAGGGPGGNPQLWDVLYSVSATITNTGDRNGEEIVQLYVSLGGPEDPRVVLRNFERLSIDAGQSTTVSMDITRRDVSNWDTASQNWFISEFEKTVYVGASSRNLPLSASLPL